MQLTLECEQEQDGRWVATVPQLPGVVAYGATPTMAKAGAQALAFRVIADLLEDGLAPLNINMRVPGTSSASSSDLMAQARELVGPLNDGDLLREALVALIERESARALAKLGGSAPNVQQVTRRRSCPT
jgi:predicted RNase H-like HicB family nuclease